MYSVKEIFLTLQGEGAQAGRAAVFLRFAGCNLWTGKEKDREKAICQFCDTQFVGTDGENGGKYSRTSLAQKVNEIWGKRLGHKYVVCTGGEPGLQLDAGLVCDLQYFGFNVAIETNGTIDLEGRGIDWICVSPKTDHIVQTWGDELKLVYPQQANKPENFSVFRFNHFFLSPKNNYEGDWYNNENTQACIEYCKQHPQWRLSLQTHKLTGIR